MEKRRGRPAGAINKISLTLKTRIQLFLDRNFDSLQDDFEKLEPKDKFNVYKDLCGFVVAKMASVTQVVEIENRLNGLSDEALDLLIEEVSQRLEEDEPAD